MSWQKESCVSFIIRTKQLFSKGCENVTDTYFFCIFQVTEWFRQFLRLWRYVFWWRLTKDSKGRNKVCSAKMRFLRMIKRLSHLDVIRSEWVYSEKLKRRHYVLRVEKNSLPNASNFFLSTGRLDCNVGRPKNKTMLWFLFNLNHLYNNKIRMYFRRMKSEGHSHLLQEWRKRRFRYFSMLLTWSI